MKFQNGICRKKPLNLKRQVTRHREVCFFKLEDTSELIKNPECFSLHVVFTLLFPNNIRIFGSLML